MSTTAVSRSRIPNDRQNLMVGLVERWPDEVVHPRICDYESLTPIALDHQNPGQQSAGLGDQKPARFEQEANLEPGESRSTAAAYFADLRSRIEGGVRTTIVDAQTAAGIDELDLDAVRFELTDQFGYSRRARPQKARRSGSGIRCAR